MRWYDEDVVVAVGKSSSGRPGVLPVRRRGRRLVSHTGRSAHGRSSDGRTVVGWKAATRDRGRCECFVSALVVVTDASGAIGLFRVPNPAVSSSFFGL